MPRSQQTIDGSPATPLEHAIYEIKSLDTIQQLIESFQLRYEVYAHLGYLRGTNRSKLEIDEFDSWAIPFGAFDPTSGLMIGTMRLVTTELQYDCAHLIREILKTLDDDVLTGQALAPRPHRLPSIVSGEIDQAIQAINREEFVVKELSRSVVRPGSRGSGISRALMELGLARASRSEPAMLVGSFLPEHLPMYARYGYLKLPSTDLNLFDSVGQIAIAGVCRTDRLPQPTQAHVDELLRTMKNNARDCVIETDHGARMVFRFYDDAPGIVPGETEGVGTQWTSDISLTSSKSKAERSTPCSGSTSNCALCSRANSKASTKTT
jgi:predicted GNAT family N-acyltransferase